MQIQKFYASSLPAAMRDIRRMLGEEAIILSTRTLSGQEKVLSSGGRARYEVTAVRESPEGKRPKTAEPVAAGAQAEAGEKAAEDTGTQKPDAEGQRGEDAPKRESEAPVEKPRRRIPPAYQRPAPTPENMPRPMRRVQPQMAECLPDTNSLRSSLLKSASVALADRNSELLRRTHSVRTERSAPARGAAPKRAHALNSGPSRPRMGRLLDELRALRTEIESGHTVAEATQSVPGQGAIVSEEGSGVAVAAPAESTLRAGAMIPAPEMRKKLKAQGVEHAVVQRLIERMYFDAGGAGSNRGEREFTSPGTFERLVQVIDDFVPAQAERGLDRTGSAGPDPRCVALAGPTGVGKTTTIAKIASFYALEENRKVALITVDTYRIAAAEQLRTYARLLGVPFEVASNRTQLQQAYERFSEQRVDLVLVDTPGHSPSDDTAIERLAALLKSIPQMEVHLALAAPVRGEAMRQTLERFRPLDYARLVFSKLDEADRWGEVLNTWLLSGFDVSYFTTGQRVPEDLEPASAEVLCRRLVGEDAGAAV